MFLKYLKLVLKFLAYIILPSNLYLKYIGVKFGKNCRIYVRNFGSEPWLINIGNNVTITSGVKILTHDGSLCLFQDDNGRRFSYNRVVIGDNVFIGVNSIILPGVIIGNNVIIGAGSVVTKSIPNNSIVGGNPAKFIKSFEEYKSNSLLYNVSESELDYSISYKNRINKIIANSNKDFL
jgi:acetyltransferase-like isoleucine patch superfamily enzyme